MGCPESPSQGRGFHFSARFRLGSGLGRWNRSNLVVHYVKRLVKEGHSMVEGSPRTFLAPSWNIQLRASNDPNQSEVGRSGGATDRGTLWMYAI